MCNLGMTDTRLAVHYHYPLFHPAKKVQDQGTNIQLRPKNKGHSTKKINNIAIATPVRSE